MLSTQPQQPGFQPPPPSVPNEPHENRRIQRISLLLPVRVEVKLDNETAWSDIARLSDVSAFGAGFTLKRPVKRGRLLCMTIPMPRQLRAFDFSEAQYKVWGTVRRCIQTKHDPNAPEYSVGVAFIGKSAPQSYHDNPSQLYDIREREGENDGFWRLIPADLLADDSHLPREFRKHSRLPIPESLIVQRTDEKGNTIEAEVTISENISLGGAAVLTSLRLDPGTFLKVTSERFNVTLLSVVRGSRVGADGVSRLHLEFIDGFFPLEGIV